jgi:hypothetical protein
MENIEQSCYSQHRSIRHKRLDCEVEFKLITKNKKPHLYIKTSKRYEKIATFIDREDAILMFSVLERAFVQKDPNAAMEFLYRDENYSQIPF